MQQVLRTSRKQLSSILFLAGALGLIFAGIHLWSYFSSGSSITLADSVINGTLGGLELVAGWLIHKGKKAAIPVVFSAILASLVYAYLVGRGLNLFALLLGGAFLLFAIALWRRGDLS